LPDPERLPDDFTVDYEKAWRKTLKEPLAPLLGTRFGGGAWDEILYGHEQSGLTAFAQD